jgi:hypothetical protein
MMTFRSSSIVLAFEGDEERDRYVAALTRVLDLADRLLVQGGEQGEGGDAYEALDQVEHLRDYLAGEKEDA